MFFFRIWLVFLRSQAKVAANTQFCDIASVEILRASSSDALRMTAFLAASVINPPACQKPGQGKRSCADQKNSAEDGHDSHPLPAGDMFAQKNRSEAHGDRSIERAEDADDGYLLHLHATIA